MVPYVTEDGPGERTYSHTECKRRVQNDEKNASLQKLTAKADEPFQAINGAGSQ